MSDRLEILPFDLLEPIQKINGRMRFWDGVNARVARPQDRLNRIIRSELVYLCEDLNGGLLQVDPLTVPLSPKGGLGRSPALTVPLPAKGNHSKVVAEKIARKKAADLSSYVIRTMLENPTYLIVEQRNTKRYAAGQLIRFISNETRIYPIVRGLFGDCGVLPHDTTLIAKPAAQKTGVAKSRYPY